LQIQVEDFSESELLHKTDSDNKVLNYFIYRDKNYSVTISRITFYTYTILILGNPRAIRLLAMLSQDV